MNTNIELKIVEEIKRESNNLEILRLKRAEPMTLCREKAVLLEMIKKQEYISGLKFTLKLLQNKE